MTKVTETKLSEIKPDQTNANRHTERGEGMIRQSISKYGFAEAGTLDKDNNVIGGNLRTEASADLGMEDAVIIDVDGTKPVYLRRGDLSLTDPNDTRARELAYALNRVPQVSIDFNPEQVLADLKSGVDLSGLFREDELSEILGELGKDEEQESPEPAIDRAEELQQEYGTESGQLWTMGEHRLLIGDCRNPEDVARLVDGKQVNGIFTSPPYAEQRKKQYGGVPTAEYVEWWDAVQSNMRGVLAEDGSFFVNIKPHCEDGQRVLYVFDLVLAMARQWGWRLVDELCWTRVTSPGRWTNRFKNYFEPVYHFSLKTGCKFVPTNVLQDFKSSPLNYKVYNSETARKDRPSGFDTIGSMKSPHFDGALPSNVIEASGIDSFGHWAVFPIQLPTFFIKAYSDPGDIWLDPFAGSGTVIMACHNEDRIGYGMEILPKYGAVILHRWEQATNQKAKLTNA